MSHHSTALTSSYLLQQEALYRAFRMPVKGERECMSFLVASRAVLTLGVFGIELPYDHSPWCCQCSIGLDCVLSCTYHVNIGMICS